VILYNLIRIYPLKFLPNVTLLTLFSTNRQIEGPKSKKEAHCGVMILGQLLPYFFGSTHVNLQKEKTKTKEF